MSPWGRVHIQTIILGDMFSPARALLYDTRDLLEDLNTRQKVLAELHYSNPWNLTLAGGRFSRKSPKLGGLGLTVWGALSLGDITATSSFLQVFPLSGRQLGTGLRPTSRHERRHLELLSEGGLV